ncbi:2-keto-3-deoxy-galactonokinase [compost metagenome]
MITNRIYCDWGTTSLRIRIIKDNDFEEVHEIATSSGISTVYKEWSKIEEGKSEQDRIDFYLAFLQPHISPIVEKIVKDGTSPELVISGMGSSSIGIIELPYAELPFSIHGENVIARRISPTSAFNYDVLLVSGVRGENEVMRGEETQLIGIVASNPPFKDKKDTIFIFPGTHAKHLYVNGNFATKIETYITGELFSILCNNGLLKEAVQQVKNIVNEDDWLVFDEGIDCADTIGLLQSLFRIRTNHLLKKFTKQQNYIFLSGLLIGYELRSLITKDFSRLVLCSEQNLFDYYKRAMMHLGLHSVTTFVDPETVKNATIRGQSKIADYYLQKVENHEHK